MEDQMDLSTNQQILHNWKLKLLGGAKYWTSVDVNNRSLLNVSDILFTY